MLNNDQKYTIEKTKLLALLRDNRDRHVEEYVAAVAQYRKEAIAALAEQLGRARDGEEFSLHFNLDQPRSFADEYAKVIGLLELTDDSTVDMGLHDYDTLVRDNWQWKGLFAASTATYLQNAKKRG